MLYGLDHAASRADLFDPSGLAAVVPHVANLRTTTGGGIGVAAVGGGGAPGDTSGSPAAGSIGPVGRNTAIYMTTVGGRRFARNRYQPSVQAPRVAPNWASPSWPGAGLAGLGATVPHVANLRTTTGGGIGVAAVGGGGAPGDTSGSPAAGTYGPVGRNFAVHIGKGAERKFAYNRYQPSVQGARVVTSWGGGGMGLSGDAADLVPADGLGDFFGWLKDRFTPPGGKISRVQLIPRAVRDVVPTPIRTAVRYVGAATQTVLSPVLTGSQQRRIFGLSPAESGVFMKAQQIERMVIAAIATYGVATGGFAATPAVATTPGQTASLIAGDFAASPAAASQAAAASTAAGQAAAAAPGSALFAPVATSTTPGLVAADFGGAVFATPVEAAAAIGQIPLTTGMPAAAAASPSLVGGAVKTALETGLTMGILKAINGAPAMIPTGSGGTMIDMGAQQQPAAPIYTASLPMSSGSGGGSAGGELEEPAPLLSATPLLLVGGAAAIGLLVLVKSRRKRNRRPS